MDLTAVEHLHCFAQPFVLPKILTPSLGMLIANGVAAFMRGCQPWKSFSASLQAQRSGNQTRHLAQHQGLVSRWCSLWLEQRHFPEGALTGFSLGCFCQRKRCLFWGVTWISSNESDCAAKCLILSWKFPPSVLAKNVIPISAGVIRFKSQSFSSKGVMSLAPISADLASGTSWLVRAVTSMMTDPSDPSKASSTASGFHTSVVVVVVVAVAAGCLSSLPDGLSRRNLINLSLQWESLQWDVSTI